MPSVGWGASGPEFFATQGDCTIRHCAKSPVRHRHQAGWPAAVQRLRDLESHGGRADQACGLAVQFPAQSMMLERGVATLASNRCGQPTDASLPVR